ncbi:hypothetical protein F0562_033454 [Nyssa sinensis]|uniref:Uncharacterized protein n=1 Tax=Nyssa sinensis TaxID=561372 RepID=A0A5J5AFR9_9ASTE|nr:hypothetical protein F0562_033454 [Nyssa sinensis]
MRFYEGCQAILKIQKFRRMVSYAGFYCFVAVLSYAYTSNTTRAGYSRADQFYASYPAGTELLTDVDKLYKAALGNCFEVEEWGPIEWSVMAKHFERQGKSPYAYHAVRLIILIADCLFIPFYPFVFHNLHLFSCKSFGTSGYNMKI